MKVFFFFFLVQREDHTFSVWFEFSFVSGAGNNNFTLNVNLPIWISGTNQNLNQNAILFI